MLKTTPDDARLYHFAFAILRALEHPVLPAAPVRFPGWHAACAIRCRGTALALLVSMTILTDAVLGRAPTTDRYELITRGKLYAEVMLTLIDMSDPDSADSEAWSQCLEEAWPSHQPELSRASAWAIVGRLTRSGAVTRRAHELRTRHTEEK